MPTLKLTGLHNGRPSAIGDQDTASIDGSLTIGNDVNEDVVTVNAEFASDIIPDQPNSFDLGSAAQTWRNIYANNIYGDGSNLTNVNLSPGGSNDQIQFNNSGSLDGTGQLYYKSGKLGIGDFEFDNPVSALHIKGNYAGGQNQAIMYMTDYSYSPTLAIARYNGNSQSPSAVVNGNTLGQIAFLGYNSVASALQTGAQIKAEVNGNPSQSSNDMPTDLHLMTTQDNGGTPSTRMLIESTGRIGINNLSPIYQLDVDGAGIRANKSDGPIIAMGLDYNNPFSGSLLGQLRFGGKTQSQSAATIEAYTSENWNTSFGSYLSFKTVQNGSVTASESMRVSANGIDLNENTDIQGDLNVSGNIDSNGFIQSDNYIRVHNNTGYIKVQATSTGIESRMGTGTLETSSVYANAYLTNSDVNAAITNMITMMAWSVTDNAIQMNATGKSARFEVYDDNSQPVIATNEDGKVYLATLAGEPQYPNFEFESVNGVHIEGNDSNGPALVVVNRSVNTDSDGIAIILGEGSVTNSQGTTGEPGTNNRYLKFYTKRKPYNSPSGTPSNAPLQIGYVRGDGNGGVAYVSSFTGIHASIIDTVEITNGALIGMIVESTGNLWVDGSEVSTALPKVSLSNTNNSKKVYGVIADLSSGFDGYIDSHPLKETETAIEVNSLGEGKVWVTNISGNIENGDYITSSQIGGYGRLQEDDLLHNYTVAKCTENINWDNITDTIQHNGQSYKRYLCACTYHCG